MGTAAKRRVAFYLRVSTTGQTVENQRRELQEVADRSGWQVVAIFQDDGISGTKGRERRPQFDAMLKAATRRQFDMIAAWSLDRLGRSLQDLVGFLSEIKGAGVDLFLHKQALDTSTSSGRAMFGMVSVFAEFEADIIKERVNAGLARARAQGKRLGRPRVDRGITEKVRAELSRGTGMLKTAKLLGVGVGTVQRIRNEMSLPPTERSGKMNSDHMP
jgi:DNA invertase Pin-like site-specific DNA recombinase